MVHRWPSGIKAFYMKRDEENNDLALGVDMIAPEGYGEIIGGGQREDDLDILIDLSFLPLIPQLPVANEYLKPVSIVVDLSIL